MTAFNIIKSLTKRGNAVIGSGCYAAAISCASPDKIIKIGNSMSDPWLDYYDMIIKPNQKNPCVPKVHSFYEDKENEYYVCIMERLTDYAPRIDKDTAVELCKDYTTLHVEEEEFRVVAANTPGLCDNVDHLIFLLNKIREYTDELVSSVSDGEGYRKLDMHAGNFLFRENQLVVTDPWCEVDMGDITDVSEWLDRTTGQQYY